MNQKPRIQRGNAPRFSFGLRFSTASLFLALIVGSTLLAAAAAGAKPSSTWPQDYSVRRDDDSGALVLTTPFYTVRHDLRQGGAICQITLTHGKATNLLMAPIETRVRTDRDAVFADVHDRAPRVTHRREGTTEIVTVDGFLADEKGRPSDVRTRTVFEYHWGYIKVRKELTSSGGAVRARELTPFFTRLAPNLCEYGYREGTTEEEGAPPFSFGSNRWGKLRKGVPADKPVETPYAPRSMMFADPGVEGLEWFVGSDLSQWETQCTGRRGQGRCHLARGTEPDGMAVSISPLWMADAPVTLPGRLVFDFYIGLPLLEGRALKPWLHTSFNRNRGDWVSPDQIQRWKDSGIQTVHCHNDGDYYGDGLFWRDGSYPPYPDMDRYDQVLDACRKNGIRVATYFSNKELHSSTREFQERGTEWGRNDRKGNLQHNFFKEKSEFGVQMCLRSGWIDFLKHSIDRVLDKHPLDGVYYDWNVALFCSNPRHEGKEPGAVAAGHWDIEELLDLMEWTRRRVGPDGLVIVHNTTTPMFVTENFADYVVANEWGYGSWSKKAPELKDLPLEWSLVGARSRGVISYGQIDANADRHLHRLFALYALVSGVTPWPASPETFTLFAPLGQIEDIASHRFADWRNTAVRLEGDRCASAVYSRPGQCYLLVANLDPVPKQVRCAVRLDQLPHALPAPTSATLVASGRSSPTDSDPTVGSALDVGRLTGEGIAIPVPGDSTVLIRLR